MTTRFRVAILTMTILLAPVAASAGTLIDEGAARPASEPAAKTLPSDEASSAPFPGPVHWAMLTVGAAFAGAALYIQRRRGFDAD